MSQPFNFFPPDLAGNSHPKDSTLQFQTLQLAAGLVPTDEQTGGDSCARAAPQVGMQLYDCGVEQV